MRVGLIGAGAVAPLHARAASLVPGLELTAVCDLDRGAADAVATSAAAAVFTDYRDLLDSGAVDAVIVNTPHATHPEMALAAMRRGLHVLVEKPMAITIADCDAMIEASRAAGAFLQVGHIQHFLPDKTALADAVRDGAVGAVRLVHDHRTTDYRPGTRSPWFLSPETAGGGALMNIGAHCLDRVFWFTGSRAVTVSARTIARFDVPVETDAFVAIELDDGVSASVSVISDPPHRLDQVTVVGEHGSLTANPRSGTVLRRDGHSTVLHTPSELDIPEAFRLQLADFAAGVRGEPSAVSLDHSRHVVEVILAAYASAGDGGAPRRLAREFGEALT